MLDYSLQLSGYGNVNPSAFVKFATQMDVPFVLLAHGFDIKKSQAETFYIVNITSRHTVEFIKNTLDMLFRNPNAVVLNTKNQAIGIGVSQWNGDYGGIFCVFYGVVHQIVQNIGEVQFIGPNNGVLGSQIEV